MTSNWSVQPGISPLDWNMIGSFPLDGIYRQPSKHEPKVEKLIEDLLNMGIDKSDPNLGNPQAAFTLASLFQIALSKSDYDAGTLFNENDELKAKVEELTSELSGISTQSKKTKKERETLEKNQREMNATITQYHDDNTKLESDNKNLKSVNHDLNLEINRLREEFSDVSAFKNKIERENEDLLRQLKQQKKSSSVNEIREVQISRENEHLLKRFKETQDELKDLKIKYTDLSQNSSAANSELADQVRQLQGQYETAREQADEAIRTRDQAEDMCSRREQRALDDMQELVNCHNTLIAEERGRTNAALEDLNGCRQRLEDIENEFPKQMNKMKLEHGSQLNQRERRIKELEDENAGLKGNIAKIAGGGSQAASKALEEIMMSGKVGAGGAGAKSFGSSSGGAEMQKMVSAMQTLQRENEDLSLQLTSAEQRLEAQEEEMLRMQKTLRVMDQQDPGLKSLRLELSDAQRRLQNVQDESTELRRRNKELQDVSAYCESLKALCVKLGVSGEELAALNVRGGNTEIEVLRAEVKALQEEIQWLERDRKHWMHKLRLQPILDTRLRLELGLTSDQLRQVDILVEKLKAGSSIVENPQDDYYDKYHRLLEDHKRQKEIFSESVQKSIEDAVLMAYRKHSDDMYHSSVKGQQEALDSFSNKLREQLQSTPLFKSAGGGNNNNNNNNTSSVVGDLSAIQQQGNTNNNNTSNNVNAAGIADTSVTSATSTSRPLPASNSLLLTSSADASELSEALKQHRSILESQSKNIEQLQETLKERFEEVVKCREEARLARDDANNAAEERDRFREVLMMRSSGAGGAGGSHQRSQRRHDAAVAEVLMSSTSSPRNNNNENNAAAAAATPAPLNNNNNTGLAASSPHQSTASFRANNNRSSNAADPNNDAGIDQLLLIESNLRKQVVQKEKLSIAQSEHIDILQREKAQMSHKMKEAEIHASNAEHRVAGLETDIKNLSSLIDAKEDRIGELSRINDDLQRATNSADREILQKIILLRQREARLLQRIRLITEERDESVARADLAHQRLVDSMSSVEYALKSSNLTIGQHDSLQTNNIALANATARIEEEDEVAASIDRVMGQLSKGELLAEDTKVVADTWLLHSRLDQQRHQIEQAANISSLRSRVAVLEDALAEKEATNRALGSINVNNNSHNRTFSSSSSPAGSPTSAQATAGGNNNNNNVGAQIEAETWKQKYTLAAKRLQERESETDMLSQSLDSAREALKVISEKIAADEEQQKQTTGSSSTHQQQENGGAGSSNYARKKAMNVATLEKELTRMKSVNLSLVRAFAEMQGERKHLQILVENKTRQIEILTEQLPVSQEKTNQVIANVMRENTMLQQQLQDASTQLKTFRVSLLAAQANSSILGNEASSYRMSAQRLMRQYMTNMIPMIESVRASLRRTAGSLPLRSAKVLQERLGSMLEHIAETEKSSQEALEQIAALRGELKDASAESQAYQAITSKHQQAGHGSGDGSSSFTHNLLSQKDKLLATQKANARVSDRKIADLESQVDFTSQRIKKQERELEHAIQEMTLLETQSNKFADDTFFNKMVELQEQISKHASASSSSNNNNNNAMMATNDMMHSQQKFNNLNNIASNFDINNPANTVTEYREAIQKQSQLNNENQRLQEALNEAKHNLNTLDSRCSTLRDELNKAENRSQEAIRALDDERAKQRLRDERVQKAHEEQVRIIQTATEHNITSLKSLLANKEKLIESLEARCKQEKAAHIEASMLDSVRLERLHEQLFRENNVTLEKLRAMVENSSMPLPAENSNNAGQSASVAVHIETLTKEVQQLRQANLELRQQNSTLEVQLQAESSRLREALMSLSQMASNSNNNTYNTNANNTINNTNANTLASSSPSPSHIHNQQQQQQERNSLNNAIGVTVEGALHRVNEQQTAVAESMRRRETTLTDQNNQLQHRISILESQLANSTAEIQRLENEKGHSEIRQNVNSRTTPAQKARQTAQTTANSVSNTLMIRQLEERNRQLAEELSKTNQRLSDNEARHKRNVDEIVGAQSAVRLQFGPQNDSESNRLQRVVESNESLRKELAQVNEQNTRLMQATALLRDQQRIQADNLSQQASHKRQELESALTSRMQQIQRESSETLNSLNKRVEALQIDLAARVDSEKTMQRDSELQAQTVATLRVQLSQKDEVSLGLKRDIEYANRVRDQAQNNCNDAQRQLAKAQQENANAALIATQQRAELDAAREGGMMAASTNNNGVSSGSQQFQQQQQSGTVVQPPSNVTNYNASSSSEVQNQQYATNTFVSNNTNVNVTHQQTANNNNNPNNTTNATNPRSPPASGRSATGMNKTPSPNSRKQLSSTNSPSSAKNQQNRHQRFSPNRFSPDQKKSPRVDLPKDHPCSARVAALVSDASTNTSPLPASEGKKNSPIIGNNTTNNSSRPGSKRNNNNNTTTNQSQASLEAAVSAVANRHVSSSNERQLESTLRDMRSLQRQTEAQLNETTSRLERERVAWEQQINKITRQLSQAKEVNEKMNIDHKKELLQVMEERRKERDLARTAQQRIESLRSKVGGGSARRGSLPRQSTGTEEPNNTAEQQSAVASAVLNNNNNNSGNPQDTTNVLSSISANSQQDLSNTATPSQQQPQQQTSSRTNTPRQATDSSDQNNNNTSSNKRRQSPRSGGEGSGVNSQQLIEAMETRHASEVVKLHDQNRQAREQLLKVDHRIKQLEEELAKAQRENQTARLNTQGLKEELETARRQSKSDSEALKRLESYSASRGSAAAGGSPPAGVSVVQTPHTLREVCEFTARLLSLEEELEATKKTLRVEKEIEVRQLTSKSEQLQRDVQNLENDNSLLSKKLIEVISTQQQQQIASKPAAEDNATAENNNNTNAAPTTTKIVVELGNEKEQKQKLQTALTDKRELEQQLLFKDGQILDLRFERESLKLRVDRLEMHLQDLLKASEEAGYKMPRSSGSRRTSPKDGKSSSSSGGLRPGSIGAGQPTQARVHQLESVIEGMKGVVSKLQVENNSLKQKAVAPEKYEQAMKDLKTLKNRDVQLQEALQAMSFKVAQLQQIIQEKSTTSRTTGDAAASSSSSMGTKPTETVSLMRKLKAAQEAAEQYQLELSGLRRLVGDKTPGSLLGSTTHHDAKTAAASAAALNKRPSTAGIVPTTATTLSPAAVSSTTTGDQQLQRPATATTPAQQQMQQHQRRVSFNDQQQQQPVPPQQYQMQQQQQHQNYNHAAINPNSQYQSVVSGSGMSESTLHQPRVLSSSTSVSGQIAHDHQQYQYHQQQPPQNQQQPTRTNANGLPYEMERIPGEALNRPSISDASASPSQLRQQLYQNYPRKQQ